MFNLSKGKEDGARAMIKLVYAEEEDHEAILKELR